jgi:hypothetical protein
MAIALTRPHSRALHDLGVALLEDGNTPARHCRLHGLDKYATGASIDQGQTAENKRTNLFHDAKNCIQDFVLHLLLSGQITAAFGCILDAFTSDGPDVQYTVLLTASRAVMSLSSCRYLDDTV